MRSRLISEWHNSPSLKGHGEKIVVAATLLLALSACSVAPRPVEDLPSSAKPAKTGYADGNLQFKEVSFLDGAIRFEIPKEWLEEYEPDGTGVYYDSAPDAGTLRVSLITAEAATDHEPHEAAIDLLREDREVDPKRVELLPGGNAFGSWVKRSSERGDAITQFWWQIVNTAPPRHIRIAMFSYTVLTANEKSAKTVSDVGLLERSLRQARFKSAPAN
jgi:hypothetical protein